MADKVTSECVQIFLLTGDCFKIEASRQEMEYTKQGLRARCVSIYDDARSKEVQNYDPPIAISIAKKLALKCSVVTVSGTRISQAMASVITAVESVGCKINVAPQTASIMSSALDGRKQNPPVSRKPEHSTVFLISAESFKIEADRLEMEFAKRGVRARCFGVCDDPNSREMKNYDQGVLDAVAEALAESCDIVAVTGTRITLPMVNAIRLATSHGHKIYAPENTAAILRKALDGLGEKDVLLYDSIEDCTV
jgi:hypothetical protein